MTAAEIRADLEAAKAFRHLDKSQVKTLALGLLANIVSGEAYTSVPKELYDLRTLRNLGERQKKMLALYLASELQGLGYVFLLSQALGTIQTRYTSASKIEIFQPSDASVGVLFTIEPDTSGFWKITEESAYNYSGSPITLGAKIGDLSLSGSNREFAWLCRRDGEVHAREWIPAHSGALTASSLVGSLSVTRDGVAISSGEANFSEGTIQVSGVYDMFHDSSSIYLARVNMEHTVNGRFIEFKATIVPVVDLDISNGYTLMHPPSFSSHSKDSTTEVAHRDDDHAFDNLTDPENENSYVQYTKFDPAYHDWVSACEYLMPDETRRVGESGRFSQIVQIQDRNDGINKLYTRAISNYVLPSGDTVISTGRYAAGKSSAFFDSLGLAWTPQFWESNLHQWLHPASGHYSDAGVTPSTEGGIVAQWNDASGNGRNVSQLVGGREPTYTVTNGINGLAAVRFDQSLGIRNLSWSGTTFLTGTELFIGFVLRKESYFGAAQRYVGVGDTAETWFFNNVASASVNENPDGTLRVHHNSLTATESVPTLNTIVGYARFKDGEMFLGVNGTETPATAVSPAFIVNEVFLATAPNAGARADITLAEFVVSGAATPTDAANWMAYANNAFVPVLDGSFTLTDGTDFNLTDGTDFRLTEV